MLEHSEKLSQNERTLADGKIFRQPRWWRRELLHESNYDEKRGEENPVRLLLRISMGRKKVKKGNGENSSTQKFTLQTTSSLSDRSMDSHARHKFEPKFDFPTTSPPTVESISGWITPPPTRGKPSSRRKRHYLKTRRTHRITTSPQVGTLRGRRDRQRDILDNSKQRRVGKNVVGWIGSLGNLLWGASNQGKGLAESTVLWMVVGSQILQSQRFME